MKKLLIRYLFYLLRWQCSTPILAIVFILMQDQNQWISSIVANFLGGLLFFWIDKLIFAKKTKYPLWEIKDNISCCECGKFGRCYRVALFNKYDKTEDKTPQFRCEKCSTKKVKRMVGGK